jgi:hypothetical protein
MLLVDSGLLSTLAKLTIDSELADSVTIPDPETETVFPAATLTICPSALVNVATPSTTFAFRPQSVAGIPIVHGVINISTTPAIATVDGSAKKPANTNVLVKLLLHMA